jgi:hypothetical protein
MDFNDIIRDRFEQINPMPADCCFSKATGEYLEVRHRRFFWGQSSPEILKYNTDWLLFRNSVIAGIRKVLIDVENGTLYVERRDTSTEGYISSVKNCSREFLLDQLAQYHSMINSKPISSSS